MAQNHNHKVIFCLYSIWEIDVNRAATYFSLFGLRSCGCQSRQRLILPPVLRILPLRRLPAVCSTSLLPLLCLQTLPLYWFPPLSIGTYSRIFYLEKKKIHPPPSATFSCSLPFLAGRSYLNECPLFPSSLPHLSFATAPRTTVRHLSGEVSSVKKSSFTFPTSHFRFGNVPPNTGL